MKTNERKKGISLIVLILTILVMIILGAAIILNIDDTKIIKNAEKALTSNNISIANEIRVTARAEWRSNEQKLREDKDNPFNSFKEYLEYKLEDAGFELGEEAGNVKVTEDGLLYVYQVPIIPEGFVASEVSTEDDISEGLVIYEGSEAVTSENVEEAQTTRNQYVWVPVPNISEFVTRDGYENKRLQKYVSNGFVTEPYSYNGSIAEASDIISEYYKMTESVSKYGGFYIARYEAGTSTQRTDSANGTSEDILSQKDKYPYNYVAWGVNMTTTTGNVIFQTKDQGKGAVELCRSIYAGNINKDVRSTLCYGVQWDAAMKFMQDVENPFATSGEKYIENSMSMGWYKDNAVNNVDNKTGVDVDANASNMTKNIYDMAGNMWEWTMEANGNTERVLRGGDYGSVASQNPASMRGPYGPYGAAQSISFRSALYLK